MAENSTFTEFRFSSTDGVMLYARKYGWHNLQSTPVVCLPDLTGNCRQFHHIAEFLSSIDGGNHRVMVFDYRGRGNSGHDSNSANYNLMTDTADTMAAITAAGLHGAHVIGTAYGGMVAMLLSAQRPGILKSVILNEAGSQIPGQELVRQKRMIERFGTETSEDAALGFLKSYMQCFFPAFSDKDWKDEIKARYRRENGHWIPDFDPQILRTLKGINLDVRVGEMWQEFAGLLNIPAMVICGEMSEMRDHPAMQHMKALKPDLVTRNAAGQGHAPRLHIGELPGHISSFLAKQ